VVGALTVVGTVTVVAVEPVVPESELPESSVVSGTAEADAAGDAESDGEVSEVEPPVLQPANSVSSAATTKSEPLFIFMSGTTGGGAKRRDPYRTHCYSI
jgi:hypothetical protein